MNGPYSRSTWPAFNLTAAAALIAVLDLLWGRTAARLLLPHDMLSLTANQILMSLGNFVSQLCGVLALVLLVIALANAEIRRGLFPHTLVVSLVFISAVFVLLSARALLGPVGARPLVYIKVAYACLSLFIIVGAWRGSGRSSTRLRWALGISLYAAAGIAAAASSFIDRATNLDSAIAVQINRAGEVTFLAAALATAFLLAPRGENGPRAQWCARVAAVVAIALTFAGLSFRFDLMETVAAHGLNLELPSQSTPGIRIYIPVLATASGSIVFALVSCITAGGAWRLIAYGVVLVLAAGYQPGKPASLAASLLGVFALAAGVSHLSRSANVLNQQATQRRHGTN